MVRPSSAPGPVERVYAIGDVHGRYDLFGQLVTIIRRDAEARRPATSRIVLLGNIIDRGPQSAEMVRGCMRLTAASDRFVVLMGSSEARMAQALRGGGDLAAFGDWLDGGGRATLRSWGLARRISEGPATMDALRAAAAAVGPEVVRWLGGLPLQLRQGEHLFVHAGIRPGVPLDEQAPADLLEIGDEFLRSSDTHGATIVHGHAGEENDAVFRHNRIGIDTGAWRSDRLTALGVEAGEEWTLNTASPLMAALRAARAPRAVGAGPGGPVAGVA